MLDAGQAFRAAESALLRHVDPVEQGCWLWRGTQDSFGYGRLSFEGHLWRAHRLAYTTWVGPLAEGLVVDHLCRVPSCIRPDHLEAVTRGENVRRGDTGFSGRTTCRSGRHDITDPANLRPSGNSVMCRLCSNEREARRRARARANRGSPD